ncbi:glycosyltransferase family protein [Streptomyces antibioticus]|uniref:Glycosyltransferase family 4 protein n=1 Tax=Streptomyces antibioticus TaxID=1890 RepID=A0AAE7CNC3_STRAT|nr:vegetative cell wall protein [Streptomyces antibioticus]OOQ46969.1 vegetative cell wall protein [Streptomyces antibioticus]QIT47269.1 glycosyltransferase family 4 protein [Streptomyces antibioticus]
MRVLYLLNISNPDRLSADSGWIFADLLAPALADAGTEVTVAAPAAAGDARCGFHRTKAPGTKYRARFSADIDELVALIRGVRPDAVVANQIEEAPAIRTALLEAGSDALLAGYCHYLPFSFTSGGWLLLDPSLNDAALGQPVLLAFAAGLAACDRVMVHSSTAASWVSDAAARMTVDLGEKLRVVPAPRDERLVRAPVTGRPTSGAGAIGVYNHRLYAHYGTEQFVHLARDLAASGVIRLRVMDLFGRRRAERTGLDDSPENMRDRLAALPHVQIVSDRGDRVRYKNLLAGARFGIAPFRPGCPWSMSVIDCQGMGLPVISPRLGWLAQHIDAELCFTTRAEAVALAERLATDDEFHALHAKRAHASTADLAPALVAARYLEAIA